MVPERLDPGGTGPPESGRVPQGGTRSGQEAADQMGTPVCLQQPGPGKDVPNQTLDQTDQPDAFQGVLPVNTPICTMT